MKKQSSKRNLAILLPSVIFMAVHGKPATALEMQPILPTSLAVKAASISVSSCEKKGNKVTTTVLNSDGNILVVIRNQSSGPHTIENSFNKAYTSLSFGGAYNLKSTREIITKIKPGSKGIGEFPLPANPLRGLSYSVGGINIISNGKVIGAIGVSGSPNGDLDEVCAIDGLNAIKANLN